MKELLLAVVLAAVFALGFYIIRKVDRFVEANQRLIAQESRSGKSKVRIAAEHPCQLEQVAAALQNCSEAAPHIAFFLSTGRAACLLEKLQEGRVDILLLTRGEAPRPDGPWEVMTLGGKERPVPAFLFDLPVEQEEEPSPLCVVWEKSRRSKDRDRVIFALENEYCSPNR